MLEWADQRVGLLGDQVAAQAQRGEQRRIGQGSHLDLDLGIPVLEELLHPRQLALGDRPVQPQALRLRQRRSGTKKDGVPAAHGEHIGTEFRRPPSLGKSVLHPQMIPGRLDPPGQRQVGEEHVGLPS